VHLILGFENKSQERGKLFEDSDWPPKWDELFSEVAKPLYKVICPFTDFSQTVISNEIIVSCSY